MKLRGQQWAVVSAMGVMQIFAWGCSYYLLTVLAAPISSDTGWPLPMVVGSLSIGLAVAGLVAPRVGLAIHKRGGRSVMALSCILLSVGLVVMALANTLPLFLVGWVILGAGMGAGLYDAAFATLAQLYRNGARSMITALTLWGGFSSTVCWPLSAWLLEQFGWRGVCLVYALLLMGICLPLLRVLLPVQTRHAVVTGPVEADALVTESPGTEARVIEPQAAGSPTTGSPTTRSPTTRSPTTEVEALEQQGLVLADAGPDRSVAALKSPGGAMLQNQVSARSVGHAVSPVTLTALELRQFRLVTVAFALAGAIASVVTVYILTLLVSKGVAMASAVLLGALVGPAQVFGRVVEMANRERHHPLWTLSLSAGFMATGLLLLAVGFSWFGVCLVVYGTGTGILSIAKGTLPLALFGPDRYAVLVGRMARPSLVLQALAPAAVALFYQEGRAELLLTLLALVAVTNLIVVGALWLTVRRANSSI